MAVTRVDGKMVITDSKDQGKEQIVITSFGIVYQSSVESTAGTYQYFGAGGHEVIQGKYLSEELRTAIVKVIGERDRKRWGLSSDAPVRVEGEE